MQQTAKTGALFLYPRLSTIAVLHLRHFETSFTNYKREEPDANRIIVIRLKTLGAYTNIQIGYTYTDLNDYSYFYTLHDIENYYVYDRAKFTYLIDKSKVIFKQRLIDDIDKPFKYISIELLEDHYIDDLSLNALKIFLEYYSLAAITIRYT
ncbi:hypothetical protein [Eubacterium sp. AF22-8LB]|uniref:hypothetical protein n=1 Tax=Eubacterium sp. AF22-8LB TaxID=2292232 RepID=UPI0011C17625|nr:hypothetical protein [Eubacterium sp. AF22-8LB]